ncbi:MAG: phosphatase PAP2 family protein [Prevotella sp.]|nr:phosphatase PAP2 family protein [Prevotella sp.]
MRIIRLFVVCLLMVFAACSEDPQTTTRPEETPSEKPSDKPSDKPGDTTDDPAEEPTEEPDLLAEEYDDGNDTIYVTSLRMPDATRFLPAPLMPTDADYIDDEVQWQWGKEQRESFRGLMASLRMGRSIDAFADALAWELSLPAINAATTPAIRRLLEKAFRTGREATTAYRAAYIRPRPFADHGEQPWYAPDANAGANSSPSATTAAGWAAALVFAEMWPPLQDDILRLGFLFGEDLVVSGSNYQSDVNAGYLCGSAAIAQAHNSRALWQDILAAREEYKRLHNLTDDPLSGIGDPVGAFILNEPVTTDSPRHAADLQRYEYAKTLRTDASRHQQAVYDADADYSHLLQTYGEALGITLSESGTPAIYKFIDMIYNRSVNICKVIKGTYFRKRPYVELGEDTIVPEFENDERNSSSYPSGHASLSWALSLMFSEMAPDRQHQLLSRAYDFGYNRVIAGYHWPTDIDAGRLMACILVAKLHTEDDFHLQMLRARYEYLKATGGL